MSTDIICSIFDGNQVFSFGWQWTPISFILSGKLIFNYKNNTSMLSKYLNKSGKSGVKAYEILRICKTAYGTQKLLHFAGTSSPPSTSCSPTAHITANIHFNVRMRVEGRVPREPPETWNLDP